MNLLRNWQTISRTDWTQETVASIHNQVSAMFADQDSKMVWLSWDWPWSTWDDLLNLSEPWFADLKNGDNKIPQGFVRIGNDVHKMSNVVCGMQWSQGHRNYCHYCEHTPLTVPCLRLLCTLVGSPGLCLYVVLWHHSLVPALFLLLRSICKSPTGMRPLVMSTTPLSSWKPNIPLPDPFPCRNQAFPASPETMRHHQVPPKNWLVHNSVMNSFFLVSLNQKDSNQVKQNCLNTVISDSSAQFGHFPPYFQLLPLLLSLDKHLADVWGIISKCTHIHAFMYRTTQSHTQQHKFLPSRCTGGKVLGD